MMNKRIIISHKRDDFYVIYLSKMTQQRHENFWPFKKTFIFRQHENYV
jgi:hypothetical protein